MAISPKSFALPARPRAPASVGGGGGDDDDDDEEEEEEEEEADGRTRARVRRREGAYRCSPACSP
eukprot:scaffold1789_cov375-Prasinococcus_capsulatus_cf.AAC.6